MTNSIKCAIKICNEIAMIPVGIRLKVRMICVMCYDRYFRNDERIQLLKILNPQELLGDDRFTIPLGELHNDEALHNDLATLA